MAATAEVIRPRNLCEAVSHQEALQETWATLRREAQAAKTAEPMLSAFYERTVLRHESYTSALAALIADKLATPDAGAEVVYELVLEAMSGDARIAACSACDLAASVERNPAFPDALVAFLYAKGFHALQTHRVAHVLWQRGRKELAYFVHGRATDTYAVDIHPAAKIGHGVFIDHATGVVVGETATIGNNVSLLHGVTLGGTGKESGDRHPKVGDDVLIGAGAVVLGAIQVGEGSRIGAGSVVLHAVPPHVTVAGVPARVVRRSCPESPAETMDQVFD
ncbi:serine O-acetyltransferase [Ferruginivarius sediminum]|uniref:Serine acetyltransferase n=1 Tax=Ferruginivarius sediminum TaxID=2661937 RepID=A0A369TAH1_9PROT|nr:serine O-acetyltransferase [Ferruginivarius sediminum]RDD61375.1 serine O-acetyltransferase [Ferruginivarius sediminum]